MRVTGTWSDGGLPVGFRAEQAITAGEAPRWVVIDDRWALHVEGCAFLTSLRAADRSVNTERVYAGRVALFLAYCAEHGVEWQRPTFEQLSQYLRWLVREPYATDTATGRARLRSKATANAVFGTASEFLSFGAGQGWVPPTVPAMLTRRRYLRFTPPGFDPGELEQFRSVNVRTVKFHVGAAAPQTLSPAQVTAVLRCLVHARDVFLVVLMLATGMRVGETLGLRREDTHFLASSRMLGCEVPGPHVHVRRRVNDNGAWAKSRYPRSIPVTTEVVAAYADYQFERDRLLPQAAVDAGRVQVSESVFVNLFRQPRGRSMRYASVKDLFDRVARDCGFEVRPHMLRHTAATGWVEAGVAPDVVQDLLGHVSVTSTSVYLHASWARMRAAVDGVAETTAEKDARATGEPGITAAVGAGAVADVGAGAGGEMS